MHSSKGYKKAGESQVSVACQLTASAVSLQMKFIQQDHLFLK